MLNPDFKEFIQSLNDNGVRYLVVGGYAVALHGYPRYTKDIDLWIEPVLDNADKIVNALDQFGFNSLGLKATDFVEPDTIIQLGYPPNRIDLITTMPGIIFGECYPARIIADMDGVMVSFIDLENLKKNKRASAQAQDLADLENLSG
jgi:predicted nucleotidyltransferase